MGCLPESSRAAVLKFRKPADLQRSLLGEALARAQLSRVSGIPAIDLTIVRTEKGKPHLEDFPDLHYNISHSGEWVVMAQSDMEVGIDVERIREPQYRIAVRFFSAQELQELNRLNGKAKKEFFFDLWTLKESYCCGRTVLILIRGVSTGTSRFQTGSTRLPTTIPEAAISNGSAT